MKTVVDAIKTFVTTRQKHNESLNQCLLRFKATRDVFLSHVGDDFYKLIREDEGYRAVLETKDLDELVRIKEKALEELFAYLFLNNAD